MLQKRSFKHGMRRLPLLWISSLKIAIIEEDIDKISSLTKELPQYNNIEDAQQALALVGEAVKLLDSKKSEILETMKKIKLTKAYLDDS